jgi:hypothetical protein
MSQIRTNSIVPAGGIPAGAEGGGIIQCVQEVVTSATTYNSGGMQIPITATITPQSTSSKILIIGQITATMDSSGRAFISLTKAGSKITAYTGDAAGSRTRAVGNIENGDTGIALPYILSFLDSPATTSAVTYGIGMERDSNTMYFNRSVSDNDGGSRMRGASSLTLLEISG